MNKSVDALPAGWKTSQDQNGNQYYYNKELNVTQWSRPAPSGGALGSPTLPVLIGGMPLKSSGVRPQDQKVNGGLVNADQ
jgi:hypothetical protein